MADDPNSKPGKYEQRVTQSIDDLRSNAKWALVAFGAIGTTLLAGSQLSNIGKFALNDGRLWMALFCAGIALFAAVVAVRSALNVANTGYVEFDHLDEADNEYVRRNPALLEGFLTTDNLRAWYRLAIKERFETLTQPTVNAEDLDNSEAWLVYLDGVVDNIMSYIRYNRIREQSDKSRSVLIVAIFIAAIAILGFAWAANSKDERPIVILRSPTSEATLVLTDQGKASLVPLLGRSCTALGQIQVIVLSVTATGNDVVSVKTKDCLLARFTITDALGKLSSVSP